MPFLASCVLQSCRPCDGRRCLCHCYRRVSYSGACLLVKLCCVTIFRVCIRVSVVVLCDAHAWCSGRHLRHGTCCSLPLPLVAVAACVFCWRGFGGSRVPIGTMGVDRIVAATEAGGRGAVGCAGQADRVQVTSYASGFVCVARVLRRDPHLVLACQTSMVSPGTDASRIASATFLASLALDSPPRMSGIGVRCKFAPPGDHAPLLLGR